MPAITKRVVDAAIPGERDRFVWDAAIKGFGLKVTPSGVKIYVLQYRMGGRGTPTKRVTIGRHGTPWTPDLARKEAKRLLGEVAAGHDPAAGRSPARQAPTLEEVSRRFIAEHVLPKRKGRTATEYQRLLDRHILPALGRRYIHEIVRADVARLHHEMRRTPYQSNRLLALLSKFFNWAEHHGYRRDGTNPCRHIEKYKESTRERFLSPRELRRLGRALAVAERCGAITPWAAGAVRLLVCTGARLNEILSARWTWLDLDRGTLSLPDSKTGRKVIHLNAPALEVLANLPRLGGNPCIIAGQRPGAHLVNLRSSWLRVRKAALLDEVRLHDLRHSFASDLHHRTNANS
jgi:integrase